MKIKTILTLSITALLSVSVFAQQNHKAMNELIEKQTIQESVSQIFVATDSRNWDKVHSSFAKEVLLDYTSMAGGEPANLTPRQIVDSWKGVLPGFDFTHHALSNFQISVTGDEAKVKHYGNAEHYMESAADGKVWTVVGTYDHHLVKKDGKWIVDQMKFSLKYMTGNMNLPRYAQEKINDK